MTREDFDVIVAGGGPAGAATAALVARAGHRVLVLEKERFPRFHVGESLLPAGWEMWDDLGVTSEIEQAGFVVKQGVNFGLFDQPEHVQLLTAEYPQYFQRPYTFHVERAKFDEILLNNAARNGAVVRQEWTVADVLLDGDRVVGVRAGANGDEPHEIRSSVFVDATGRNCLLSRKLGWRKLDPVLNKTSHWTHFRGAQRRCSGDSQFPDSTMTEIHTIDGGWIWFIPLSDDIVSVGAVLDAKFAGHTKGPQECFDRAIASSPLVREWMVGAKQTTEMQTVSNISYLNDRFVGDGFVLVGDASMFIDPVFSAGVTIALRGATFAAACIQDALESGDVSAARFQPYEDKIRVPMGRVFKMIRNWYSILEKKDMTNNIFVRARKSPLLRERLIVLLSGGYDKVDLEAMLRADSESEPSAHAS